MAIDLYYLFVKHIFMCVMKYNSQINKTILGKIHQIISKLSMYDLSEIIINRKKLVFFYSSNMQVENCLCKSKCTNMSEMIYFDKQIY